MRNSRRSMKQLTPEQLLAALRWRYATKQFDAAQKIPDEVWDTLEETLVLTPSSFGLQPWKFIVVKDPELRLQLQAESWNQTQTTEASHFVVFAARTDLNSDDIESWIARMSEIQGRTLQDLAPMKGMIAGFCQAMSQESRHDWNVRQVYIALGQLMGAAAVIGIDTCPMEGISAAAYDRLLGLENSGYATAVACALGYRSSVDKYATTPKARFERTRVVTHV
jgi:nitroreductase